MSDSNPLEVDKTVQIGDSVSQNEKKSRKDKSKALTKVVIRRLPPSMDEETFLNQIQPVPEYDYFYFVSADWSLGRNATSRAYINFLNEEDIFIFKDRFDGYVFVETTGGVEYPAIVEFAPFQGLPKSKSRKKDNKCNTIDTDPDFIKFLSYLSGEAGDAKPEMKMEYSYQIKDEKKITSTPLLEFIANKKVERREERKKKIDERKRQRDDDRNRKKNQVAKLIPSSIREQEEDGIIVRVVKSRPRDRDRGDRSKKERSSEHLNKPTAADAKQSKPESNREEKRRLEREQRDQKRKEERQRFREERDQKRQAERERNRKERESSKNKDDVKTEKSSGKTETDAPNKSNQKEDRVKRYSESRRARMESKDQGDAGNKTIGTADRRDNDNKTGKSDGDADKSVSVKGDENKDAPKEKAVPHSKAGDSDKSNATEDAKNQDDNSGDNAKESSSKSLTKEERLARRIRNKDRPSLQIYQPGQGKRRMSTKKDDEVSADDASPNILSKPSSPTSSENAVTFPTEKPSTAVKKVVDKAKKDRSTTGDRVKPMPSNEKGRSESSKSSSKAGPSASKTAPSQDEPVEPKVERKVSRYSERRNKIKEKQISKLENVDAATDVVNTVDECKNNSGEITDSEIK
ncbi:regulator of nonsense transcripts 3A-like [Bradysia coprophila]|uniref:regulator of nonsense transcripts 3A-like n=1 Tax=Bradysia coprophila TaxID=38358 RepID=UPI00187D8B3F|nr:regulator of nonsense transcripts 3A-like [Bradysia coprophila]